MITILLVSILLLVLFLFLHNAAKLLIKNDNIESTENTAIVLLMGSVGDRSLGAAELYNEGKANKVVMVESCSPGVDILREKNITVKTMAERSKSILEELAVNEEDIIILSGNTKNTKDEAIAIRKYLEDKTTHIDSIILVTSKYHSFRSKLIFQQVLRKCGIIIYSAPTDYDSFFAKGWYFNRSNVKRVITEYIKLIYFLFVEWLQIRRS